MGLNYVLGPWRLRECDKMVLFPCWLVAAAPKNSVSTPVVMDNKVPCDHHGWHAETEVYLDHLVFQPDTVDLGYPYPS